MPVFDVGSNNGGTMEFAHHLSPTRTPVDEPGGRSTLPWGQQVFDYFTSLPLSNPGPYRVSDEVVKSRWQAARPRVDMNGLRVHGRIDLNAAPWYVMKGLPFVPMYTLPNENQLRRRVADALVLDVADNQVHWIGEPLAQSIAAYRDGRAVVDHTTNSTTGNYGNGDPTQNVLGWRGWGLNPPEARRGTGFLTVGELANVRHTSAYLNNGNSAFYRSDSGAITGDQANPYDGDYVQAIAALVALSDWVTVRSHVFTVYGTVRGSPQAVDSDPATQSGALSNDPDTLQQQLEDVDSRALRFQETLDRLPLLLGQPEPTRIGGRALTSYSDFTTD